MTPDSLDLLVDGTAQLTALQPPGPVEWSSSNAAVASVVRETGFVRGVGRGDATISGVSRSSVATARVRVSLPPGLALSGHTLAFAALQGGSDPDPQTLTVTNSGDGVLTGVAVGSPAYGTGQTGGWLTASVSNGTAPATVTFRARSAGLSRGVHTASIPVVADGVVNSPQSVSVVFRVNAPASIVLSSASAELTAMQGTTAQANVDVTNGGDLPLGNLAPGITYASGGSGWLAATLAATPGPLMLVANAAGLATGTYGATVTITSSNAGVAPAQLEVRLTVTPGPAISLSTDSLSVHATYGISPPVQTVRIANTGGGTLSGLSVDPVLYGPGAVGWLQPNVTTDAGGAGVNLAFNTTGLGTGTYLARMQVRAANAANSPRQLTVALSVGAAPTIGLSPAVLPLGATTGGTATGSVALASSGPAEISGLLLVTTYAAGQTPGWLDAQLAGPSTPTTINLVATSGTLAAGTYNANVRVTSTNPGVPASDLQVTFVVGPPPVIALSAASVQATTTRGVNASTRTVTISNSGGAILNGLSVDPVQYQGTATGWLSPQLTVQANGGTLTLGFQSAALNTGTYDATVTVRGNAANSPQTLPVRLTVNDPPTLSVTPAALSFSAWGDAQNRSQPAIQSAAIASVGGAVSGLQASTNGAGWLRASLSSITSNSAVLQVQPLTTDLSAGTYTATVTVSAATPGVAARTINVTYTVRTFSAHVAPLLGSAGCSGCHASSQAPVYSSNPLTYCQNLRPSATSPSATSASRLYQKVVANPGLPHGGGKFPSIGGTLLSWISGNAPAGSAPCK